MEGFLIIKGSKALLSIIRACNTFFEKKIKIPLQIIYLICKRWFETVFWEILFRLDYTLGSF